MQTPRPPCPRPYNDPPSPSSRPNFLRHKLPPNYAPRSPTPTPYDYHQSPPVYSRHDVQHPQQHYPPYRDDRPIPPYYPPHSSHNHHIPPPPAQLQHHQLSHPAPPGYPLSSDQLPKSASNPMTPAEIHAKRLQDDLEDAQKGILRPQRSRKCQQLLAERMRTVSITDDPNNNNNTWTITPEQLFLNRNQSPARNNTTGSTSNNARSQPAAAAGKHGKQPQLTAPAPATRTAGAANDTTTTTTTAPQTTTEDSLQGRRASDGSSPELARDSEDDDISAASSAATQVGGGSGALRRTVSTSIAEAGGARLATFSGAGSGQLRRAVKSAVLSPPTAPMYTTYTPVGKGRMGVSPLSATFQQRMIRSDYAPKRNRYKALLVGISYRGIEGKTELPGIKNDLREVYLLLTAVLGYHPRNIRILSDLEICVGEHNKIAKPTFGNILEGMKWISAGAINDDSLFFFFAGHGDVVKDYNGDEIDSDYDQCLVPWDFATAGPLIDDLIFRQLIRRIPHGVRLTCLIDACTSGTICDLPFLYTDRKKRSNNNSNNGDTSNSYCDYNTYSDAINVSSGEDRDMPPTYLHDPTQKAGESVLFSGAADLQQSAEIPASLHHPAFGVMTRAFVDVVLEVQQQNQHAYFPSFSQVLAAIEKQIHHILQSRGKHGVEQDPQISSSHLFNLYSTPFSF